MIDVTIHRGHSVKKVLVLETLQVDTCNLYLVCGFAASCAVRGIRGHCNVYKEKEERRKPFLKKIIPPLEGKIKTATACVCEAAKRTHTFADGKMKFDLQSNATLENLSSIYRGQHRSSRLGKSFYDIQKQKGLLPLYDRKDEVNQGKS